MRSITITLPDEVAHIIEVRAAIDDLRLPRAIELLLREVAIKYKEARDAGTA